MTNGYTVRGIDFANKETCLTCRVTLPGTAYELIHDSGRIASPYCSEACADLDAEAGALAEEFEDDEGLQPMDEPR